MLTRMSRMDVNKIYVVSFFVRTLKSSMGRQLADAGGLTKRQADLTII